jgi:ribonucleoside-triphosphate reductase
MKNQSILGIKKRDGKIVDFEIDKIQKAIQKAFDATESAYNQDILQLLSLRAVSKSQSQIKDHVIDIEILQDNVEEVLEESGFTEVAKAYIIYRKQHQNLRELSKDMLNFSSTVNDYLEKADWRVKENSTVSYSIGGLILHNSGTVIANYWLNELYDE